MTMGTLTIHFEGICTQIKLTQPIGDVLHRVVLVHAEHGRELYGQDVPPHLAFLAMDEGATVLAADLGAFAGNPALIQQPDGSWQLFGVRLRVANAAATGVTYTPSSFDIPSLTTLAPNFGPLSPSVVFQTDAACHFDVSSGTFSAEAMAGGAFRTSLDITTTDASPVLLIETLSPDGTSPVSGSLTLSSGSTIVVSNTGGGLFDKMFDFYLHYLTAQTLPINAGLPKEALMATAGFGGQEVGRRPVHTQDEALGPGCSNSNFP
jgi:hypothetical protein